MDTSQFFAGLFLGATLMLGFAVFLLFKMWRRCDAERMLALNKCFVREGQHTLFSPEMIAGDTKPPEAKQPGKPFQMVSPFRKGILDAKERMQKEADEETGSRLPDSVKEQIRVKAEELKNKEKVA